MLGQLRAQGDSLDTTRGYVSQTATHVIVSFRGTSSITDALTDLDLVQSPLKDVDIGTNSTGFTRFTVNVHNGFKEYYTDIRQALKDAVQSMGGVPYGPRQIITTGCVSVLPPCLEGRPRHNVRLCLMPNFACVQALVGWGSCAAGRI